MTIEDTLLVVVDAQKGFVGSHTKGVIPNVVELVRKWQEAGGATVFTRMFNYPGSPLERLVDYTLMQHPPETDLLDELAPFVTQVIGKRVYSIFNEEGTECVKRGGYKTLAFCGFDTEACVLKSAFDAFDLGYVPLVIEDATASSFGEDKQAAGILVAKAVLGERQVLDADAFMRRAAVPSAAT